MITSKDLRAFTKQILNEDDDNEDLNDYDVNHLDYQYIEKCTDIKELKKLLKILKSGKEGYFLQMEDTIQKKLEILDPSLKQEPLPKREDIANELNDWVNSLKKKDENLKNNNKKSAKSIFTRKDNNDLITNELTFNTEEPTEINNRTDSHKKNIQKEKRIKSTDYRKWDLYDVENEINKIDNEDKNNEEIDVKDEKRKKKVEDYTRRLNKEKHIPSVSEETKTKSYEELKALAEIEKNKGNDCYKSKDYEEALIYYTRSLDLLEMPNVYTNRALVNLKMSRFSEAENDATEALRMNDPKYNFKAYLRRGESYSRRARYREAINDFSEALKLEPDNKEAENFLIKAQQNYLDVEGELAEKLDMKIKESEKPSKPKKKMIIKEVDEIKDDEVLPLNTEKTNINNNIVVEENNQNTLNKNEEKELNKETKTLVIDKNINNKKDSKINNLNNNVLSEEINDGLLANEKSNIILNNNISNNNILIEEINDDLPVNDSTNEKYDNNLDINIVKERNHKIDSFDNKKDNTESFQSNQTTNNENYNETNIKQEAPFIRNNNDNGIDKLNDINIFSEEEEEEEEDEEGNLNSIVHDDDIEDFALKNIDDEKNKINEKNENDEKVEKENIVNDLCLSNNINEISILSEEEEEEEEEHIEYCNFSDNNQEIDNKYKMKSENNKNDKKNIIKSYIDSLKFYNEDGIDDDESNINGFNEDEIRKKLENLKELNKYMNNKFNLGVGINDDENNIEEDSENIGDNDFNDSEDFNYMEFLKAKEKERYDLYEKTMKSNSNDIDDDLNDIYNSEDDEEILSIINSQLKQGDLNDDERKYISQLLRNKRSQASLGSDNSDFESSDYESSYDEN